VLVTAENFRNLFSKDRFLKLKDFTLKCIRCLQTYAMCYEYIFYAEAEMSGVTFFRLRLHSCSTLLDSCSDSEKF